MREEEERIRREEERRMREEEERIRREEEEMMDVEYFPEEVMDVEYFTVLVDPYSFNIDYDPNLTISDIKGYIFNATGIPVLSQNYIIIVDDIPYTVAFGTLAENNILPNTTLISIPI